MKYATFFAASLAGTATALTILSTEQEQAVFGDRIDEEKFLLEFGPGETRWHTEDDKWVLRRVSIPCFFLTALATTTLVQQRIF